MHYLLVCRGEFPESRPWVEAEFSEFIYFPLAGDIAKAKAGGTHVMVPADVAVLNPEYGEAARAWFAGDDSAIEAEEAREVAEYEAEHPGEEA